TAQDGDKVALDIERVAGDKVKVEIKLNDEALKDIGNIGLALSVEDAGVGMVAVLVNEDGSEEIIKKSVLSDDKMLAIVDGSSTVKLLDKSRSFDDVDDGFWGQDAVAFATSRELFLGVSETEFGTGAAMTRGMFATVLHRLEDAPAGGDASFDDVDADSWYAEAVSWAAENEVVTGTGDSFNPGANVTREEIALILYRYAIHVGLNTGAQDNISQFNDADQIADWASDALNWAVGSGLMQGKDNNILDPAGHATRTEVAAMLQRLITKIVM
ncbi:MAG: S-layer homology domain-containing protein, partial [Firmicutes bacterium]|nr:S-layer homology domain-containing protein [Bacillota bacterium]